MINYYCFTPYRHYFILQHEKKIQSQNDSNQLNHKSKPVIQIHVARNIILMKTKFSCFIFTLTRPDKTVRTVFWSLFGRGDATIVELDEFEHIFTQYVGYWIFGAYNWCSVIVLLNMLIAMMSRSFELIQVSSNQLESRSTFSFY